MNAKSLLRHLGPHRGSTIVALSLLTVIAALSLHKSNSALAGATTLVKGVPSNSQRVTLPGNVHPLAQPRFDVGAVPASFEMRELKFVLQRSAAQESALENLLTAQQTPGSPQYRKWLTPTQFGAQFGAGDEDLQAAKTWLEAQGFSVGDVSAGRGVLPFTGTAAQVQAAFQTPIHSFIVNGVKHFANTDDPQIPAALAPLVAGIRGLHDFRARSDATSRVVATPDETTASGNHVTPSDYAIIYDFVPLYQHNVVGAGVTVVVAAQSDISLSIPANYWNAYGVYQNQQLSSVAAAAATDPGRTGDGNESEAYLDVEIIGALAPKAKIVVVRDMDVGTAFEYAINNNLGGILNVSFSACEKALGSSTNAGIKSAFQQAVAEGITVVVSSGDSGIAECDDGMWDTKGETVVSGLSVNGLASTPYNVAVGGTDFNPLLVRQGDYWDTTNAAGTYANAKSYIPEMVWNFSCANPVTASLNGFSDPLSFCNSANYASLDLIAGAGGGVSTCTSVAASGACSAGYAVPSWQTGVFGIQAFTGRAIPDVSMLANNWIGCDQIVSTCGSSTQLEIFNGTSAAAPAMSAIVALVDAVLITSSDADGRQGNLNPWLYHTAAAEYGQAPFPNTTNLTSCNANTGAAIGESCVFYDITTGSNSQPCKVSTYAATSNLPLSTCASAAGDAYGLVEVSSSSTIAYGAGQGYDLATGLGSINVAYLVEAVAGIQTPTNLVATASGGNVNLAWTGLATAKSYSVYDATTSGAESAPTLSGITATSATVSGLTPGQTYFFFVTALTTAGTTLPSEEVSITLPPAAPTSLAARGTASTITLTWNPSSFATSYNVLEGTTAGGESGTPVASGITGTSYIATAAAGNLEYFQVVAVGQGGASLASNQVSATVLPTAPTGLTATASSASVALTWSAGKGAASYNVYEGASAGAEGSAVVMNVSGTTATVTGLSNSTTYYFTVSSVNSAGTSAPSNEASATPTAASSGGGGGGLGILDLLLASVLLLCRLAWPAGRAQRA